MDNLTVLVKESEQCPLVCVYCYEGTNGSNRIMDSITLVNMIEKIETRSGVIKTTYVWHGKEPLTAGIDFFRRARDLQRPYETDHCIHNGMQTNGVLLTPELADFFVQEHIDLGFSLDGPAYVHNLTRPYKDGRGSFEDTMNGIRLMRERGQTPGVSAVLSRLSLPFLDEIYDFFRQEGLNFKFNPIMICGNAENSTTDLSLTVEEKAEAICHLFDRWFYDSSDGNSVCYDSMNQMIESIFTKDVSSCNMMRSCQDSFISVGVDGTIFPCSRFSDPSLSYGNINQVINFEEVITHPQRLRLLQRYDANPGCHSCDYGFLCYSGCMHNAYITGDIMGRDPMCGVNQLVYEHIASKKMSQLRKDDALKVGG